MERRFRAWRLLRKLAGVRRGPLLNPEGLRFADECARHKVLDVIGDLALAGLPLLGAYRSVRGGHKLNHAVLSALMADRTAWRVVEGEAVRRPRPFWRPAAARLAASLRRPTGPNCPDLPVSFQGHYRLRKPVLNRPSLIMAFNGDRQASRWDRQATPLARLNPGGMPAYAVGAWGFFGYTGRGCRWAPRGRKRALMAARGMTAHRNMGRQVLEVMWYSV